MTARASGWSAGSVQAPDVMCERIHTTSVGLPVASTTTSVRWPTCMLSASGQRVKLGAEMGSAYTQGYNCSLIRHERNKVIGDDSHFMAIYTEFLNSSDTGIDQPQPMLLATSEAEFGQASVVDTGTYGAVASAITTCKVHLPVDQIVVRCWSNEAFI